MYYDIVENMDDMEAMNYDWEEIDGKPRYRWYKYALNSVYMISSVDEVQDIENFEFDDLDPWYESVAWVAKNDPEALIHIMSKLINPVTHIVKQKLIENLEERGYFASCAIIQKHLSSHPAPKERTFQRKKEKYTKRVNEDVAKQIVAMSEMLCSFKKTAKEKLYSKNLREPLSKLLNTERFAGSHIDRNIEALKWLMENTPEELEEMFNKEILIEIKENFLNFLANQELYNLCAFFNKIIPVQEMDFYFKIPPYEKEFTDDDLPISFDDEDYFDDSEE